MAGVRLRAQLVFVVISICVLLLGMTSTNISRHFGTLQVPTIPLIGTDILNGVNSIYQIEEPRGGPCDLISTSSYENKRSQLFDFSGADSNGSGWFDSERVGSLWILDQPAESSKNLLEELFITGINLYGCNSSSCSRETWTLSKGFSKLHINVILAVEETRVFHSSYKTAEISAFHIQDALRVFEDIFSVNIALRVARNVNWQPFLRQSANMTNMRTMYALTTYAMRVPIREAPYTFPLDELLGHISEGDKCGPDCRVIDLIMYQHSDHQAMVTITEDDTTTEKDFDSLSATSFIVGEDVGISVLNTHILDSTVTIPYSDVEAVVSTLLDQLRVMLGVDSDHIRTRGLISVDHEATRTYVELLDKVEATRQLMRCDGQKILEFSKRNEKSSVCPLVCYWESRVVVAASALLMHTRAVESLEQTYQLMGASSFYLYPTSKTISVLHEAEEQVRLSASCRERIQSHRTVYITTRNRHDDDEMDLLLKCLVHHSSAALRLAHSVLYDPQIGRDVKDGYEFLTAILLPYWLPVLIPLLFGLVVEIKRFANKSRRQ